MKLPYIVSFEIVKGNKSNVESSHMATYSLRGSRQKPMVEQLRFVWKGSKRHGGRMMPPFEGQHPYRPHFRMGKRVCINCSVAKIGVFPDLVLCSYFGWEISLQVAKSQQLCKEV